MPDLLTDVKAAVSDRYAIERPVGAGGMATVFLAQDRRHNRPVAIKVLQPELAAAVGADRFLREIEIVANLTHPHILPLHDSGEAGGFVFYVMPYLAGESLRERITREKQLGIEDALKITRQVAEALSYAHSHGVVHRDIKPENIMFEGTHAVVTDFGIARAVSAAGEQRLTQTGLIVGTPGYMSPEHAAGAQDLDGRSDIYALGCVLYEMLAGQPPFTGPTVESIVQQHLAADVPSITVIRHNVPDRVAAALRRSLEKTPADRFATGTEFARELETAQAQILVSAEMPVAAGLGGTGTMPAPAKGKLFSGRVVATLGFGVIAVAAGILLTSLTRPSPGGSADGPRLSVLPFENLGAPEQEYFAAGITDEITVRLASVAGLSVIARQSALQYKQTTKTPQQIGDELGVDYMLLATISWQQAPDRPSRVRVRPRLIRASDASQLWGEVYDEELTEVFEVQSNIAGSVVEALGVALVEPERQSISAKPTENLEAYDFYLQGNDYANRPASEENYRTAEGLYGRALALDPQFALAAARLSIVHSLAYWYYFDRSERRLTLAREAVDKALAIDPDLPEAHLALGELYYRGYLDYDRALEELSIVGRSRRDDTELLLSIGFVERRQGKWDDAARHLSRASELEPRSASNALQAGVTYLYSRDYEQAERHFVRAMTLAPDEMRPRVWLGRLAISSRGDTATVRSLLAAPDLHMPRELDPQTWWHWALFRILDGTAPINVARLEQIRADSAFRYSALGELYRLSDQPGPARAYFDSARTVLEARTAAEPDEARFHSELGIVYAALGMRDEAIREGTLGTTLLPISKEALTGPDWVRNLAQIYVMLGMYDEAVAQLERLLSVPSSFSGQWVRLDPIWAPLRSHARFRQLVTATE